MKWKQKGAAAARSGRFRDMYSAWNAAKGKPKLTARDRKLGVTFNGKMVDAKEYFFEGFLSVQKNPKRKKNAGPRSVRKSKKYKQFRASGKPFEYAYTGNYRPGQKLGKKRLAHAKKMAARKPNPGTALKAKIKQMKPRTWYSTTLSGAQVKVKRVGQGLVVRPATKRKQNKRKR